MQPITTKLRNRIMDGTTPSSNRQLVELSRRYDQSMRQWAETTNVEEIDEEKFVTRDTRTTYPEEIRARLREEGRYFGRLGRGFRPTYDDAPYRYAKHLSYEKAKALLAKKST